MDAFTRISSTVWGALMLLSLASVWVGTSPTQGWTVAVLTAGLAGAKMFLILHVYMDVRHAPRIWQGLLGAWLLFVSAVLTAGRLVS